MATAVSEFELEAFPELGGHHESAMYGEGESEQFFGARYGLRPEVDGFENAAVERKKLRGEAQFGFVQAGCAKNFRNVAMLEDRIGRKIFGNFAKARLE